MNENGFKVRKPAKIPPGCSGHFASKYGSIWAAVSALLEGEALPVECEDVAKLDNLQAVALGLRSMKLRTKRIGLTLYIWKKEQAALEAVKR